MRKYHGSANVRKTIDGPVLVVADEYRGEDDVEAGAYLRHVVDLGCRGISFFIWLKRRREKELYKIIVLFGFPLIFLTRYQSVRLADRVPLDFLMESVMGFSSRNNTRSQWNNTKLPRFLLTSLTSAVRFTLFLSGLCKSIRTGRR